MVKKVWVKNLCLVLDIGFFWLVEFGQLGFKFFDGGCEVGNLLFFLIDDGSWGVGDEFFVVQFVLGN